MQRKLVFGYAQIFVLSLLIGIQSTLMPVHAQEENTEGAESEGKSAVHNLPAPDKIAAIEPKIVAGQSVGPLRLGMSQSEMEQFLARPAQQKTRGVGMKEVVWRAVLPASEDSRGEIRVVFASERAIQIKVEPTRFVGPNGISTQTTLAQVLQLRAGLKLSAYSITSEDSDYQAYFYDDMAGGLAFMIATQDHFDHSVKISAIYVHRPGKPVMPDRGARPIVPTLNRPAPPPPAPRHLPALGNGLPITEAYSAEGVHSLTTKPVLLPGQVMLMATAAIGENSFHYVRYYHPITHLYVAAIGGKPVWQDADSITLSWGYRKLQLAATKQTRDEGTFVQTGLYVRIPYRDFLDLAGAGKFYITVAQSTFTVSPAQSTGIRVLAQSISY